MNFFRQGTMSTMINVKTLRAELSKVIERVRRGERFTVLFRSRPVFRIVPVDSEAMGDDPLEEDPLYRAPALGRSRDGRTAADHDRTLYPKRRR